MAEGVPTMMVKESGGVVSASIEETNRVRAQLGLKPLGEGKPSQRESELASNSRQLAEDRQRAEDEEAMRAKLEDARRQRLLHAKLGGKSIGEQLEGEEMDSAAAWIAKSRRQEGERKTLKAERRSRPKPKPPAASLTDRYDEYEQDSQAPLAGALVGHSSADFKEGEEVVLTLADAPIMEEKDGAYALNEAEETLENVNMAEDDRRRLAREAARGVREKDDPFASSGVLDKYDEAAGRATTRLDASGGVDEARQRKLAAVKARLAVQASAGGASVEHDLSGTGAAAPVPVMTAGSDYMSAVEAEAAGFKRPVNREKKKLRKKVRDGLDLDAMAEAEAAAAAAAGSDLGSRAQRERKLAERVVAAQAGRDERALRFDTALGIAEDRAARRLREPGAGAAGAGAAGAGGDVVMTEAGVGGESLDGTPALPLQTQANGVVPMEADEPEAETPAGAAAGASTADLSAEVDAELYAALARARRLRAVAQQGGAADRAACRLSEQLASADRWVAEQRAAQGPAEDAPGSIEFCETGEFVKAVQAKDDESDLPSVLLRRAREQSSKLGKVGKPAEADGATSVKVKREVKAEEGGPSGRWGGDEAGGDESGEEEEEEEEEVDEQLGALHDRPAAQGLGAALQMARTRGMLGEEKETAGRAFDMKGAGMHQYEKDDGEVKLNYYDEWGRKMTPKEAFRQLSWKFHGKGPGKKQQEKRMVKVEMQMKKEQQDHAMQYMGALQRAQQQTKSAHVVITGAHAIKASEVLAKPVRPLKDKEGGKKKAKLV